MAEKKYAKYFVTKDKTDLKLPEYRHNYDFIRRIVQMDADMVPGARFYNENMWILPGDKSGEGKVLVDSHTHDWGQMLGFYVFNFDDIHNLGCEIEFTIDGKKYIIKESFTSFIPAGVQHGPLIVRNVTLPLFFFSAGPTELYG